MVLLTTPPQGEEAFWPFALLYLLVICIVLLPTYVMNALPLFFIARRRGLKHAWLAWVPIGGGYVLGSISDDYQLLCRNELKNRRLWLPLLTGTMAALCVVAPVLSIAWIEAGTVQLTLTQWILLLTAVAAGIAGGVIKWIATYDLFRSCEPYRAGTYLGICIAVQFLLPNFAIIRQILMLVVCKKDLGMPALNRPKQEPEDWRPVQPRKEPWEI